MAKRHNKKNNKKNQISFRINGEIRIREVRLVGDNVDGGVMETSEALRLAERAGLDLVEINSTTNPSICKILDYSKFIYEEKKKIKELNKKKRENAVKVKEIRLGPNTDEHDMEFKARHAINFLQNGDKVNVNILFKGRNIIHKERGEYTLLKFAEMVQEYATVENLPKMSGRKMDMNLKPIKK